MINFKNDTPTFLLSPLLDQDPILKCDESISLGHEAVFSTACETLLSARRSSVRQPQTHAKSSQVCAGLELPWINSEGLQMP